MENFTALQFQTLRQQSLMGTQVGCLHSHQYHAALLWHHKYLDIPKMLCMHIAFCIAF